MKILFSCPHTSLIGLKGLKKLFHVDFDVFWAKRPQIKTEYLWHTRHTHRTRIGRYQVKFQERINHALSLSEFSKTRTDELKTNK